MELRRLVTTPEDPGQPAEGVDLVALLSADPDDLVREIEAGEHDGHLEQLRSAALTTAYCGQRDIDARQAACDAVNARLRRLGA